MAPLVKNPPAMQEAWVRSLGWEDPLEEEMATHSSILIWEISQTEERGRLQSMGSQSWTRVSTPAHVHIYMYVCMYTKAQRCKQIVQCHKKLIKEP